MKVSQILHLAVLFMVGAASLQAEDSRWRQLQAMGEELFGRGRYAEAQKTFETALRELEKSSQTDLQRLQSMNSLAMAFQQQGLLNQADAKYAQALDLSEKYPEHDLTAKVSNNLAHAAKYPGPFCRG